MGIIDTIKDLIGGNLADHASGMTDGLQDQATEHLGGLGDQIGGLGDQVGGIGDQLGGDQEQQ